MNSGQRIERISLRNVTPSVFPAKLRSQIWGNDTDFVRGGRYLIRATSGAGKSSLCSFIYGNRRVPEYRGDILFNGENIATFSHSRFSQLRRHSIAYLPQDLNLFVELTAMQNIQLKNSLTESKSEQDIIGMMCKLGIETLKDIPVAKLSAGQQQRVAVVRALCQPFDFLLLDEPVSHLDPHNNKLLFDLVAAEADANDAAIIVTSVGTDPITEKPFNLLEL